MANVFRVLGVVVSDCCGDKSCECRLVEVGRAGDCVTEYRDFCAKAKLTEQTAKLHSVTTRVVDVDEPNGVVSRVVYRGDVVSVSVNGDGAVLGELCGYALGVHHFFVHTSILPDIRTNVKWGGGFLSLWLLVCYSNFLILRAPTTPARMRRGCRWGYLP